MRKKVRRLIAAAALAVLTVAQAPIMGPTKAAAVPAQGPCETSCDAKLVACYAMSLLNPAMFFYCDEYHEGCIQGCKIA